MTECTANFGVQNDEALEQVKKPPQIMASVKAGRFAVAWAAETEEYQKRIAGLTNGIISLMAHAEESRMPKMLSLLRELGSLLMDSVDARKIFSKQSASDLARIVACQSWLLSSSNEVAHEWSSVVLACMVQDEDCKAILLRSGPQLDSILAGLLRMVSGPSAASCTRQRHAIFALQALTASEAGQHRLMAVRRKLAAAR